MLCAVLKKEGENIKIIMIPTIWIWMMLESEGCCSNPKNEVSKNKARGLGEAKILRNGGRME